jgi:hypothetical protein
VDELIETTGRNEGSLVIGSISFNRPWNIAEKAWKRMNEECEVGISHEFFDPRTSVDYFARKLTPHVLAQAIEDYGEAVN